MPRTLPLAWVASSLLLSLALAASAYDFSVAPGSPEVTQLRYGSSDIIDQTGGGPVHLAANLGLGTDELDGFSYGKDLLVPVSATAFVSLQFSVSPGTVGAVGSVIATQRNGNGAAGDKFFVLRLRNQRFVGPSLESDAPNHHLTPLPPQQSDIDGLSFPPGTLKGIYWTVARGGAHAPSDIYYVADPGITPPVLYATTVQLGLLAADNVDALAIKDGGTRGVLDANDVVYVSLDTASPTRTARGGQDDILQVYPAPIAVAVPFNRLGITSASTEEIDAITGYDPDNANGKQKTLIDVDGPTSFVGMLDIERVGGGDFAVFGQVSGGGYWTTYHTGGEIDPPESVTLPAGFSFGSDWHALKGVQFAFSRGTGIYNTIGERLELFEPAVGGGFNRSTAISTGDSIPGTALSISSIYRCHATQLDGRACFGATMNSNAGPPYWVYSCDDGSRTWQHRTTLGAPGMMVGGYTLNQLETLDAAPDTSNPALTNVYGVGTSSGGPLLLRTQATWSGMAPAFSAWSPLITPTTPAPGGGFFNSMSLLAGGSAVFHGHTTTSGEGIYRWESGVITAVADKTTPVPGGVGNFTGFDEDVSNDEGATTFVGQSTSGTGIYSNLTGRLQKIVQVGDVLEGLRVTGVDLSRDAASENVVAFVARFAEDVEGAFVRELPVPFDTSDVTQRAIQLDVELDPDPTILGPDPRALLVGDLGTARLRGIWNSNGTLGTVTIPGSEVARLLALQFGPATTGGIGEWAITVDVATGMILSSTSRGTLANGPFDLNADTNGGPWTSPLVVGGIPGTQAGFETNAGGEKLFCSDAFSQIAGSTCAAGGFGFPAASHYNRKSGFVHMTGPLTLGNRVLWGFLGDQRWLEASPATCSSGGDLDSDGVCDLADNCVFEPNAGQQDAGGIGAAAPPNGRGDACECGDVSNNGRVTTADATLTTRAQLVPPTAQLAAPDKCNVGGSVGCTTADAVIATRALLVPPTASVQNVCAAAAP